MRLFIVLAVLFLFAPFALALEYQLTDLGTLGGTNSSAFSINNAGGIVGSSTLTGDVTGHAFKYTNGMMTDLGTLGGMSAAFAINKLGDVSGYSDTLGRGTHAFKIANGVMTDLGR